MYKAIVHVVGCSGFPIPVSRYWGLFQLVEISDTEIAIPGRGTTRRFLRESPEGFTFTALAPKAVWESGFKKTEENETLLKDFADFSELLSLKRIVFAADASFGCTKEHKSALSAFLTWMPQSLPPVVFDFPEWSAKDILSISDKHEIIAAYNPLKDKAPGGDIAYMRLPGPAGKRSRYDDASVEKVADHIKSLKTDDSYCIFYNIDMQTNASAVRKHLEEDA